MTVYTAYPVHIVSFLTALFTLTCTLSTQEYHNHYHHHHRHHQGDDNKNNNINNNNNNFKIPTSTNKGQTSSSSFSELLKLHNVSNKIRNLNLQQSLNDQIIKELNFNDFEYLDLKYRNPPQLHENEMYKNSLLDMLTSTIKSDAHRDNNILNRARTKSTNNNNHDIFATFQQPHPNHNNNIIDEKSSTLRQRYQHVSNRNLVLQLLDGISKSRNYRRVNDFEQRDFVTSSTFGKQNTTSSLFHNNRVQTWLSVLSNSENVRQLRRHILLEALSSKHAFSALSSPPHSRNGGIISKIVNSLDGPRFNALRRRIELENSDITRNSFNQNNEIINSDKNSGNKNNNNNNNERHFYSSDYSSENSNHGDNNDNSNDNDDRASVMETGNESMSKSAYDSHVPLAKRDWKKKSRLMQYLRHRAGSVKGRKPLRLGAQTSGLRVSQKSRLRHTMDEDIVRREPLRQPLALYGFSNTKETSSSSHHHQTTCRPDEDGSQPMRCPSNPDTCLYDSLLCDGKRDCSDGEDETVPICVMRHWTTKILRKIDDLTKAMRTG